MDDVVNDNDDYDVDDHYDDEKGYNDLRISRRMVMRQGVGM